jgi:hypothetical protein
MSIIKPLVVDWKGLVQMGWPYGRTHTWRLMKSTIEVSRKVPGMKRRVVQEIPNPDPFPTCHKANSHFNSPPLWRVSDVLAYFEAHGLRVTEDWNAP